MTYEAERHEVERLRDNLLGDLIAEQDPIIRYHALTREQAVYDALVSEIKRLRGEALSQAQQAGASLAEVAEAAGLGSPQRVHQLIAAARAER